MINDSTGRELNINDEVAFSVGTSLKTGKIISMRTKHITENWAYNVFKVALTVPENRPAKVVYEKDKNGGYVWDEEAGRYRFTVTEQEPRMFRNVKGSERIILLKPLDNSAE